MGENEGWAEPGGSLPNGLLPGAGPVMQAVDAERWLRAEERTAELIACIQPNQLSEERRNAVADYVQRLIMKCFPCQVCTFGSVPLKTYLPDGDIDLTAFSQNQTIKDSWASQVRDMLESEEKNENAEFHVKEVQYIQAEVKIIKCLVENIVVDISFNQVGGLCTLCFLDEVDNLIDQNHLFKRSIILIKAWCYYESRILGAHHGLISTYALETLVLYIFHVFNNSFHGPLEVLYRFLEFFSNFDWDNFCVSLWGPVPISSLPDVTAKSPRKDSGELLLSKLFLDACSSVYAVFPAGQESNGQPFVSKHFNVIDPLRVNNNLGRSVSKGNFFRIRSAFAFGAKKLARLLVCPKENLTLEVNQFFMNTWERHGSGHRPDAPGPNSWRLRLLTPNSPQEVEISNNNTSRKNPNENSSARTVEDEAIRTHGFSPDHGNYSARMAPSEFSAAAQMHNLKSQLNLTSLQVPDKIGRDTAPDQVELHGEVQRDTKADLLMNDTQGQYLFARTRSSPELTERFADVSSQALHHKAESAKAHAINARLDTSNRRKNLGAESLASHSSRSSGDDSSSRHVPSQHNLDASADSNVTNSYHPDLGSNTLTKEFLTSGGAHMMPQEEQDLVNMMASAALQGFNGQFHVPFNLNSGHLPFPIPPSFLASMGYTQQNIPGFLPTNLPLMDPSLSNMQFPHGLVSPHLTHYFPPIGFNTPPEDSVEQSSEIFAPAGMKSGEADSNFWREQDVGSSGGYEHENGNIDMLRSDDKPPTSLSGLKYVPPFRASSPGTSMRLQQKHSREKHVSVRENIESFPIRDARSGEVFAEDKSTSSRFSSGTHNNSMRSRTSSESSWDGSVKASKSTKEKRGKKVVPTDIDTGHGKGKIMSEHVPNHSEEDDQEWEAGIEMVESHPGAESVASLQVTRHHIPSFEVAQSSGSEQMMPFGPMLIGPGSRQRTSDNSGLIAFYPTGPPIPFLTMLPLYNVSSETGTSDASSAHFGGDETSNNCESLEDQSSPSSIRGTTSTIEALEEQKPDILNSDFASHWQNLQLGRLCQNPQYHGPLVYPSPVMVPPVYLQGRSPFDINHGRPSPANANIFSQLMTSYDQHMIPVAPPQLVSNRPPNIYDMPRYRSGTGTYLPNPKVSMRERHPSGTRRGNYNHDRNDSYSDREGNWNANAKSRGAPRSNSRVQTEKSNSRTDRLGSNESRADRSWNSFRQDSVPSYQSQNGPSHASSSQNGHQNAAYGMYTNPTGVSNGPVLPVVMFYPFDHNASYGSHGEQLEFGSLRPGGLPGINEQSLPSEGTRLRAYEDHRLHGNSAHQSSPDPPSSPRHQREHFSRNRR